MIYTPANLRITNGFAIFQGTDGNTVVIRQNAIESVKARYYSAEQTWELTVRMNSSVKHHFLFSSIGDVLQSLLGI